jgi:protocatechuate 3,4-dioxygenase alpha subunit
MSSRMTASQTVGPFFEIGLGWLYRDATETQKNELLSIRGRVLDGDGQPIPDAVLEIWQAHPQRRQLQADPQPTQGSAVVPGFARVPTDAQGAFRVYASRRESLPGQAAHLCVLIFMRGLLKPVWTRMYFPDDPNRERDPALSRVPAARRDTLIAKAVPASAGKQPVAEPLLEWNVHMQGPNETVFFEL